MSNSAIEGFTFRCDYHYNRKEDCELSRFHTKLEHRQHDLRVLNETIGNTASIPGHAIASVGMRVANSNPPEAQGFGLNGGIVPVLTGMATEVLGRLVALPVNLVATVTACIKNRSAHEHDKYCVNGEITFEGKSIPKGKTERFADQIDKIHDNINNFGEDISPDHSTSRG